MDIRSNFVQCKICKASFDASTLLQNCSNDSYCRDCFKRSIYAGKPGTGDSKTKILNIKEKKFIPNPAKYVQSANLLHEHKNLSTMSFSKRPLQCPKTDCKKFISVCSLESHFKHEHKEVPVVHSHLNTCCSFQFNPRDLRYYTTQCFVLLKLRNAEISNISGTSRMTLSGSVEDQQPILILMATRIANVHLDSDDEEDDEIHPEPEMLAGSDDEVFTDRDMIIIWVASNIQTTLSYTVAVSTLDYKIRRKFFGPLLTLSESAAEKMSKEGSCLILTYCHSEVMSLDETKSLVLDVAVHSTE
ncbi:uncharacterized protein [Euwallacea similis]|uniref:uncharacterized protein n=1 Tax=Euwallacea similis TaxID=1736056 RepID=UPI00344BF1A7